MRRLFSWAAYAVATAAILWMIFVVVSLIDDGATSTRERGEMRGQIAAQQSEIANQSQAAQLLADQVTALGERPVISPERIIPSFPSLIPGIPGPSGLPGLNGVDGIDGKSIIGPQGESITGPQGVPGESIVGSTGKDGRNGKDSTVPGPSGSDGRGISSMSCGDDGAWTITYDDGTSQTADGPCRADPAPVTPDPTPAP